jgi:hypothetical protein
MALSTKAGFGVQTALFPVTTSVAGPINTVIRNVGVAIQNVAGASPMRITKLSWRVDLAPDVPAGTVNVPVRWRLFICSGIIPQDIGVYQQQAFPTGSHPEVPANTAASTPNPLLWDAWLDFSAGDPGLNRLASEDWADSGPTVAGGETVSAILCPILDSTMPNVLLGAANAQVTLALSGMSFAQPVGAAGGDFGASRSLPRYDVAAPGGR